MLLSLLIPLINWDSILNGFISNLLFAIASTVFVFVTAFIFVLRSRSKRLRFLRINAKTGISTLPIYIAHLVIVKGGALLVDGTPSVHFEGRAVPLAEVEAGQAIERELRSGVIEALPARLLSKLAGISSGFVPLNATITPSPLDVNKVKNLTRAVIIGGPEFNTAAQYYLDRANLFRIVDAKDCAHPTISVRNREGQVELLIPDSPNYNLGIIERVSFEDDKQVILILSGVGTNGTLSAVDFFLKNWKRLNKKVGNQDFGICLQCPKRDVDPDGHCLWTLRREYPEGVYTGSLSGDSWNWWPSK